MVARSFIGEYFAPINVRCKRIGPSMRFFHSLGRGRRKIGPHILLNQHQAISRQDVSRGPMNSAVLRMI